MTDFVLILKLVYFEQKLFRREKKSHSFYLLWVKVASIFVKPATLNATVSTFYQYLVITRYLLTSIYSQLHLNILHLQVLKCFYCILKMNLDSLFLNPQMYHLNIIKLILYTNIEQILVNSLHGLLNCETGGLDCHVITTEYRTRVHCIHM